jgi:hypothetical protein
LSNNQDTGRQGEFLAAYILETHGIEVHHVDRAGADLWCKVNGKLITLQVKAASTPRTSKKTAVPYYIYFTKNPDADYFCFVALDIQMILIRPTADVTASTTRIAPADFNEFAQIDTIKALLA